MKALLFLVPALVSAGLIRERQLGKSKGSKGGGSKGGGGLLGGGSKGGGLLGGGGGLGGLGKTLNLYDSTKLTPEVKPGKAVRVLQRYGPVPLKARTGNSKDSGQQNFMFSLSPKAFCKSCTILRGKLSLVDDSKKQIAVGNNTGVYIHHILTYDTTKKSSAFLGGCGGLGGGKGISLGGSKFIGSGEDNNNVFVWYTNPKGEKINGFHIGPADRFLMNADLVSLNSRPTSIYIAFDIEYVQGLVGSDSRETLLDVSQCGGGRINANAGRATSTKSGRHTFKESGSIILAKGHLHAGGDRIEIYINNKLVCTSKAIYDNSKKGSTAISEMTLCPNVINVKAGDVLSFTVKYDTTAHAVRHESHGMGAGMPDVMGMLDMVFTKA